MARRPITQELYDAMCQSFRLDPGNAAAAARAAGCDRRMAKRGWELGWPYKGFEPVSEIIGREKDKARQAAAEVEAEQLEHVAAEKSLRAETVQEVREAEALMVSLARSDTTVVLSGIALMAEGLSNLGEKIAEKLKTIETVADPKEAISLYKSIALAIRSGALSAKAVVELERMVSGDPAVVPGSTPTGTTDSETRANFALKTPDELAAEIRRANVAMQRAQRRGLISIPGGLAGTPEDEIEAEDQAVDEREAG